MRKTKKLLIAWMSLIAALVILMGCLPNKQGGFSCVAAPLISKIQSMLPTPKKAGTPAVAGTGPTRPHPPVRTGDITTGTKVQVASQSIDSQGGTIAVSKAGDPLDGFVIKVPPKSYADSRTFKVSSAQITKQTFGSDITPVSPMISVDNGGGYSDQLMYVRVPVKVPQDNFAMGFLYDEKTRQLEGMPLLGSDAESVTVATRHFSNFFVGMIEKALLKKDADSGFRPGIDDWQFPNEGSYIAPGGHCEGQALSAIWYYCTQPDGKDMCLYGRYDNNGVKPATPALWQDDSLGYRFCSVVQADNKTAFAQDFWLNLGGKNWEWKNNNWEFKDVPGIGDEAEFNLFAYSIRATGEPQEVILWSSAGGGHAMVVYKIVGNALYISDPNYPGNTDRKIIYYSADGKFKPYNSGANKKEIDAGKGTAFETILYSGKSTIISWDKIAQRWGEFKAGTIGKDMFPKYELNVVDSKGTKTPLTDGYITAEKILDVEYGIRYGNNMGFHQYRDGSKIDTVTIELNPGDNLLGFYMFGQVNNENQYVDFKYFNVKFEDGECKNPPPPDVLAKLQNATKFSCQLLNLPTTIEGHGSMQKWVPGFKFTKHFYAPTNTGSRDADGFMAIKWSGTSFSGGGMNGSPDTLTGRVCYSGGKVLVSFDYVSNDPKDNLRMSVKNLPCDPQRLMKPAAGGRPELIYMGTDAPVVKGYVTTLEWKSHEERPERNAPPEVWDAVLTAKDWSGQCGFAFQIH